MAGPEALAPEALLAHVTSLRRLARALVRDADEADDLAQDSVEALLTRPPRQPGPLRAWLAVVLRNRARMNARGSARRQQRETAAVTGDEAALSPEQMLERAETGRSITALVLALDEPFRSTVLLRFYEDRSAADIAREQGVPQGTVRWRLKEGLDRVRAQLDQRHGERRRWMALLAPLALPRAREGAPLSLLAKGALMSTKTKIAAGLVVLVCALLGARLAGLYPARPAEPRPPWRIAQRVSTHGLRLVGTPAGVRLAPVAEPEAAGALRLQGQVIDGAEAPVANALVGIDTVPPRATSTDVNGVFAFAGLPPRSYRLEAQAGELYAGPVETRPSATGEPVVLRARPAGRLRVQVLAATRAAPVGMPVGQARVELRSRTLQWQAETDARGEALITGVGPGWRTLRVEAAGLAPVGQMVVASGAVGEQRIAVLLEAGVAVEGRVLEADGRPVAGARVWPRPAAEPFPVVDPAVDAVTSDGDGRWRLAALTPGSYQFAADHPAFAQSVSAPVFVRRAQSGIDIRLERGGRLVGEVRDGAGAPVAAAQVRAAVLSPTLPWADVREAFTDAAGRFQLRGLARRQVQVVALHETGASAMVTADLAVSAEAQLTIQLALRDAIAGQVVDGRGQPVAEAHVQARPEQAVRPSELNLWELRGLPAQISDARGRFEFRGLPAGAYKLRAARPGTVALQQATVTRTGDREARVLVRGDGTIVGRVQLEGGQDGAAGQAPPAFTVDFGDTALRAAGAADGSFSMTVPADKRDLTVSGPSFVSTQVAGVEVEEDGHRDLGTIKVRRGRALSGRVLAPDGTPVAEAQVVAGNQLTGGGGRLFIASESRGARETTTDRDGRYVLGGFDGTSLVVVAERAGLGRSDSVPVAGGPSGINLDLVLRPIGGLDGRVLRDGKPFPDTVVIATQRPHGGRSNFFVTSGPDGRYAFDNLSAGSYVLQVFLNRNKDSLILPLEVQAGRRGHRDVDIRAGNATVTLRVQTDAGVPVPMAQVFLISAVFPVGPGDTVQVLRDRGFDFPAPTTVAMRPARGPVALDGLLPGTYTACAATGPAVPLRCVTREISGNTDIVLAVPEPRPAQASNAAGR